MAKFTYLIGAGASANAIPAVSQFLHGINDFKSVIDKTPIQDATRVEKILNQMVDIGEAKKEYSDKLQWLAKECQRHASIDTFARKLYLSGQTEDIIILKFLVSEMLTYFHIERGVDKRYDAFLGALFQIDNNGNLQPPSNINIISWNYDRQIEFATREFMSMNATRLQVDNFLNVHPRVHNENLNMSSFGIYKINGTIGGMVNKTNEYSYIDAKDIMRLDQYKKNINLFTIDSIRRYVAMVQRIGIVVNDPEFSQMEFNTISYSWEEKSAYTIIREKAFKNIEDTKILVVIGYSFPVFNRNVDMKLFEKMTSLDTVYIQCPKDTIDGVIQRFKSTFRRNITVVPINNVDEFYIPFEYN